MLELPEGIWKPGTAAPSKAAPKEELTLSLNKTDSKEQQNAASSGSAVKKRKQLTGATKGMRFMQRKAERAAANKKRDASEAESDANQSNAKQKTENGDVERTADDNGDSPIVANYVDMYGVSAKIVGRRSFGTFNNAVESTYKEALRSIQREKASISNSKREISDEEMLRRYEKYIKGGVDSGEVDARSAAPIGNLKR